MIDWAVIDDLTDQIGPAGVRDIVGIFCDETGDVVDRIAKTGTIIAEDLHFIRGSAMSLGMTKLVELCRLGERDLRNGRELTAEPIIQVFRSSCEALQCRMAPAD